MGEVTERAGSPGPPPWASEASVPNAMQCFPIGPSTSAPWYATGAWTKNPLLLSPVPYRLSYLRLSDDHNLELIHNHVKALLYVQLWDSGTTIATTWQLHQHHGQQFMSNKTTMHTRRVYCSLTALLVLIQQHLFVKWKGIFEKKKKKKTQKTTAL